MNEHSFSPHPSRKTVLGQGAFCALSCTLCCLMTAFCAMAHKKVAKNKLKQKRIAVVTGGGDCPGLNAVIRAVVKGALNHGWEVYGIERGFEGLLHKDRVRKMDAGDVRGIAHLGGTILGTTNRGNPFNFTIKKQGKEIVVDLSQQIADRFFDLGFDALVTIGGDGTLKIAQQLARLGLPIIGVPKTIDNDLAATEVSFGFNTAVTTATEAIDKLHATAQSHERVMVVELMGHYSGWIALYAGIAGGADVILIPEIPFTLEAIARKIQDRWRRQRRFAIVVAAEGAKVTDGEHFMTLRETGHERLGGVAEFVAREIHRLTKRETRSLVLGHLQRGGQPTTTDRLLATRFGAAAVRAIDCGEQNVMMALQSQKIITVPLEQAISETKFVPLDSDIVLSARDLGISFGDD